MEQNRQPVRILTFDIEEWFHILDNDSSRGPDQWSRFPNRIRENTVRILDLLGRTNQRATFFCLGWVAERFPDIIRRIDQQGYEIASHTHYHQLAYEQSPEQFEHDVRHSVEVLSDITGKPVRSFRVPGFSIGEKNKWCFESLARCGIEVDSSVFPAPRGHGGYAGFPADGPSVVETQSGQIREFPINTTNLLGKRLVFSGGGYFRLCPWSMVRALTRSSPYIMTYFHPRDFDAGQPVLPGLNFVRRFKSYWGLSGALKKLEKWLELYSFTDIATAEKRIDWETVPRVALVNEGTGEVAC